MRLLFSLVFLLFLNLAGLSSANLRTLYNSLDPLSISQHLAFYELYSESPEGQAALRHAWGLLAGNGSSAVHYVGSEALLHSTIQAIVSLINKQPDDPIPNLSEAELTLIESLGKALPNRKLRGCRAESEKEVLELDPQQIDLARGLFLTQLGPQEMLKIRTYEALIDLMALQIRVRLPPSCTPADKITAMNDFIFVEMGYRFPPHSLYAKDIDLYTFLPSVLDSRRGVCLGVSILYICLAQRLDLALEMITPPGHIYVRCNHGDRVTNIETTARGVHIDSQEYLSIDTRALQQRNIKEVIGLAHFNQASVFWQQEKYREALNSYERALPYLPDDKQLLELMAYNMLFAGRLEEGTALLKQVKEYVSDCAVSGETIAADFLQGAVDVEGIKAVFKRVDETRQSVLEKKEALQKALERFPKFRAGVLNLAVTWIQLHRHGEALEALERYYTLDPSNASAEYYLAMLYIERLDYSRAWSHFRNAEKLVSARNHRPKALESLRRELAVLSPEY